MGNNVYVKTKNMFSATIDCNEFYFDNVNVSRETGCLSLYNRDDNTLVFKCSIDEVEKFVRMNS